MTSNAGDFVKMTFPNTHVNRLTWHPILPYLVCVTNDENRWTVLAISIGTPQESHLMWKKEVRLPEPANAGTLIALSHHPSHPWLLLLFEQGLHLWDYQKDEYVARSKLPRGVTKAGGFFPDTERVWTLSIASSGSVDWSVWNYQDDTYQEYELERYAHYGRGAVLHPSGLLIGALWSGYACGYLVHRVQPLSDGVLGYYEHPTVERDEYENYLPAFSPDGNLFAFVANAYVSGGTNMGCVCIYEVETAILQTSFSTGSTKLNERGLQFANAATTLVYSVDEYLNFHEQARDWKLTSVKMPSAIQSFTGHSLLGLYAIALENEVIVLVGESTNGPQNQSSQQSRISSDAESLAQMFRSQREEVAERFLVTNERYLRPVGSSNDA